MKAMWNGQVVADAPKEDLIFIERSWYFPPSRVNQDFLRKSDTQYTCPWKGECTYFDVGQDDEWSKDSAFAYMDPEPNAIDIVKKDFGGYVVFTGDSEVKN
jgi:uncharacterized protein (DUF427 family)